MKKKLFTLLYNICFIILWYKFMIYAFRFLIEHGLFDWRLLFLSLIALYVREFHHK